MKMKSKVNITMFILLVVIISLSTICYASPSKYGTLQVDGYLYYGKGEGIAETPIGTTTTPIKGVSYDKTNNTLTLNNYTGTNILLYRLGDDFKVNLIGKNKISANWLALSSPMAGEGIEGDTETNITTNVTFQGTGSLEINGCIYLDNIVVNGANIKVTSDYTETIACSNLEFKSGKLEVITNSNDKDANALSGKVNYSDGTTYDNSNLKHIILNKTIENVDLKDSTSEIKISTTTENVSKDVELVVKDISKEELTTVITDSTNYKAYDITLQKDSKKVQPNGKVKVSIPVPNNMDTSKLVVYRINEDNTKFEYDVKIENIDGKTFATFETDHFSTYVLAEKSAEQVDNNENTTNNETIKNNTSLEKDETPKTGNENYVLLAIATIMIASICIIALYKKQK